MECGVSTLRALLDHDAHDPADQVLLRAELDLALARGAECGVIVAQDDGTDRVVLMSAAGAMVRGTLPARTGAMMLDRLHNAEVRSGLRSIVGDVAGHTLVGEVLATFDDGSTYAGRMVDGVACGRGCLTRAAYEVRGRWENGVLSGECRVEFDEPEQIGISWFDSILTDPPEDDRADPWTERVEGLRWPAERGPAERGPAERDVPVRPGSPPASPAPASSAASPAPGVDWWANVRRSPRVGMASLAPTRRTGNSTLAERVTERRNAAVAAAAAPAAAAPAAAAPAVAPLRLPPIETTTMADRIERLRETLPVRQCVYQGEIVDGGFHGRGILLTPRFDYEGEFRNNAPHGRGTLVCETRARAAHSVRVDHGVVRSKLVASAASAAPPAPPTDTATDLCKICYSAQACVLLLSCRHLVSCEACHEACRRNSASRACPICRAPVRDHVVAIRV